MHIINMKIERKHSTVTSLLYRDVNRWRRGSKWSQSRSSARDENLRKVVERCVSQIPAEKYAMHDLSSQQNQIFETVDFCYCVGDSSYGRTWAGHRPRELLCIPMISAIGLLRNFEIMKAVPVLINVILYSNPGRRNVLNSRTEHCQKRRQRRELRPGF